jgi:hypothetical protein
VVSFEPVNPTQHPTVHRLKGDMYANGHCIDG